MRSFFNLRMQYAAIFLVAVALRADVTLCPNLAGQNGSGTYSITAVAGPLDSLCGTNSAETMYIPNATADYARLAWDSGDPDYPAGLTLGSLGGVSANVSFSGDDDPFYMLAFTDATDGLGQTYASDQILMIEFQPSTLSGSTMTLDPGATLFNLYDNTQGFYLSGGQSDTNTLAGWLLADPFLSGDSLDQVRIGIGLAGGDTNPQSVTVYSADLTTVTPEPGTLPLLSVVFGAAAWGIRRSQLRSRRS
jgi:hypothetical protein